MLQKMEEVSVGAAGSTSVVDLSGDSHLQVTWTTLIYTHSKIIDTPGKMMDTPDKIIVTPGLT